MNNYLHILTLCTNIKQKDYALFFGEGGKLKKNTPKKKATKTS